MARRRELIGMALVLAAGMAVAFKAGTIVGQDSEQPRVSRPDAAATAREAYSPRVLDDPYFLQQQRRNVEALEQGCEERGELCAEARQARAWLAERQG